jgi:hypothetical protein
MDGKAKCVGAEMQIEIERVEPPFWFELQCLRYMKSACRKEAHVTCSRPLPKHRLTVFAHGLDCACVVSLILHR